MSCELSQTIKPKLASNNTTDFAAGAAGCVSAAPAQLDSRTQRAARPMEVDVGSDDGAGPSGDGFTAGSTDGGFKINIKNWHGVASWTWTTEDDLCGICHMALDGSAPGAPGPGDDSPVVWGRCTHYFHVHCIETWLNNKNTCPICRGKWVLANAPRPPPATPGNRSAAAPAPAAT